MHVIMSQNFAVIMLIHVILIGNFVYCDFFYFLVPGVDFSITQFVRNLGLEHLMDIFEREQVST